MRHLCVTWWLVLTVFSLSGCFDSVSARDGGLEVAVDSSVGDESDVRDSGPVDSARDVAQPSRYMDAHDAYHHGVDTANMYLEACGRQDTALSFAELECAFEVVDAAGEYEETLTWLRTWFDDAKYYGRCVEERGCAEATCRATTGVPPRSWRTAIPVCF